MTGQHYYVIIQLEDLVIHERDTTHQKIMDFVGLEDELEVKSYFNSQMSAENLNENRWMKDFPIPKEMLKQFQRLTEDREIG